MQRRIPPRQRRHRGEAKNKRFGEATFFFNFLLDTLSEFLAKTPWGNSINRAGRAEKGKVFLDIPW